MEIELCARFATVRQKVAISKTAAAKLTEVAAAITAGKAALEVRREAFAARSGVGLEVASWKDAANAARESIYVQIRAWELDHGEERGYADRFFPAGNSRGARVTRAKGSEDSAGGGKPTG